MSFLVESLRYMMDKESILIKVEAIVDWQPIADNLKVKLGKEVMRGQAPKFIQSPFITAMASVKRPQDGRVLSILESTLCGLLALV